MAQVTALQATCLPGQVRSFSAKSIVTIFTVSGIIAAVSSMSGRAARGGVPSGIDEAVRNEFQFPHIPDSLSEDERRIFVELRTMLEQQLIGDIYIGGSMDIDGDIYARGILL